MTAAPRVEILLLNWNGWRDTIECLQSVFALDYANFGVVVCDNASSDGSAARIESWARGELTVPPTFRGTLDATPNRREPPLQVEVLDRITAEAGADGAYAHRADLTLIQTGGNLGFSGGNNVGLRHLLKRGEVDYVWLLNNDTVVAPDSLRRLVECAERDARTGAVGATVLEFDRPEVVQYFGGASFATWRGRIRLLGQGFSIEAPRALPGRLDYVSGGCMLVPTSVVNEVGLLDERFFMYSEDADWCFCMREAGYRIAFARDAEIWHKGGASSVPGSPLHDYHNMVGNLLVMQKHHPWHLVFTVPYALYRYLAPKLVRRQWKRASAILRAFRDVAFGGTGVPRQGAPAAAAVPVPGPKPLVSSDAL